MPVAAPLIHSSARMEWVAAERAGELTGTAGASRLTYKGSPRFSNRDTSGASTIKPAS